MTGPSQPGPGAPAGAPAPPEAVSITVDGRPVAGRPGEMVIAAAERAGTYIPRFCWHPRMKPVGMCRMCLVEISGPRGFSLQPSCFVPVAEGMEVVTTSEKVRKAQDGVLEFLLVNHPLDCPVCDRGGECPLQDQTFGFGPGESRFIEEKRHWAKPIPISPLIALDRERCIQCARCTRFAEEVAGDPLIDFLGRGSHIEVAIFADQPFDSNLSGNIVEICPVGALTAKPYRFKARPWDLEAVESTCTACSVGCRMAVQSSTNQLVRNLGIDADPVNHGWLCDRGRFGYEPLNSEDRVLRPLVRKDGEMVEVGWAEAIVAAATGLRQALDLSGPAGVAILGGARLPNEDAYAWSKLARTVLGTDNVDCQLGDGLPPELVLGLPRATIDDACRAPATVVLGPDLAEELPVLHLRLRGAVLAGATRLVEIVPKAGGTSPYADPSLVYRPGESAKVARALAAAVADPDLDTDPRIRRAADALGRGGAVVVLGRPSVAESELTVADAAAVLAESLPGVRFLSALRRGNVHGALDMGLAPGLLPGRVRLDEGRGWFEQAWGALPAERGLDCLGALAAAAENRIQGLVLVGADPVGDCPDRLLAGRALDGVGFTLAVDQFLTASSRMADVVLPAAGWAERPGTTTNLEGRVSRLGQKVTAPGTARADWTIAVDLARALGGDLGFEALDAIAAEIEALAPSHRGLTPELLAAPERRDGVVVPLPGGALPEPPPDRPTESIETMASEAQGETVAARPEVADAAAPLAPLPDPAGPARPAAPAPPLIAFSGGVRAPAIPPVDAYSLRLVTGRAMWDGATAVTQAWSLAPLAEEGRLRANPGELDDLGVTTGDTVRVWSGRGSLVTVVVADSSVPRGSAVLAANPPDGAAAHELIDASSPVIDVRLESVAAPGASR